MNLFQQAINDIFKDENFLEHCFIGDDVFQCIVTSLDNGNDYTDAGLASDENFALSIKLPVQRMPKIGEKVRFREKSYKVLHVDIDSANTSIYVYLESLSKGA